MLNAYVKSNVSTFTLHVPQCPRSKMNRSKTVLTSFSLWLLNSLSSSLNQNSSSTRKIIHFWLLFKQFSRLLTSKRALVNVFSSRFIIRISRILISNLKASFWFRGITRRNIFNSKVVAPKLLMFLSISDWIFSKVTLSWRFSISLITLS